VPFRRARSTLRITARNLNRRHSVLGLPQRRSRPQLFVRAVKFSTAQNRTGMPRNALFPMTFSWHTEPGGTRRAC
jgi:hypothetical protein